MAKKELREAAEGTYSDILRMLDSASRQVRSKYRPSEMTEAEIAKALPAMIDLEARLEALLRPLIGE